VKFRILVIAAAVVALAGCTPIRPTTFVHPDYNFGFVERVAVVPFENLTEDRGAGARMTRYFVTELLAVETFEVVEPGEVTNALTATGGVRVAELPVDQIKTIGSRLGAQALFLGSVTESAAIRTGNATQNVVTFDVRMVETETGSVIWSTTLTQSGRGFWASLFGTSGRSLGEVTRRAARHAIALLVD
jgi:polysaccharide biosynthesis protein PelC